MTFAIHNDDDHARALKEIERLWGAEEGSDEARDLARWVQLVDDYENAHHAIDPPEGV